MNRCSLVIFAAVCCLFVDRLSLMNFDSELVKSRVTGQQTKLDRPAEPVVLRQSHGYSDSERKALDRLVTRSIREAEEREQAQQIAHVLNITPKNINAYKEWW